MEELAGGGGGDLSAEEKKMTVAVLGGRGLKRCSTSTSSSNLQQDEKRACFLVYAPYAGTQLLYCVDFGQKRRYCQRCCSELEGGKGGGGGDSGEGKESGNSSSVLRELIPWKLNRCLSPDYTVVGCGSKVYALGGCITDPVTNEKCFCREVLYFDANRPEQGWIRGPDMLKARHECKAVAIEGKIYVFSGNDLVNDRDPWAEVLDPDDINNKWEPLPPPLEYIESDDLMAVPYCCGGGSGSEKKIMVGKYFGVQYTYHLRSGRWEKLGYLPVRFVKNPAVAGNILYWTDRGILRAMNTKTRKRYYGKIKGSGLQKWELVDEIMPSGREEPSLIHLGGKMFCYFTLDKIRGDRSRVRCIKFQVSKRIRRPNDGVGSLKASVVSRDTFIVAQPFISLDGLAL